jgi:hypothetical protein
MQVRSLIKAHYLLCRLSYLVACIRSYVYSYHVGRVDLRLKIIISPVDPRGVQQLHSPFQNGKLKKKREKKIRMPLGILHIH